jgi:hypothetical protein
MGCSPHSLRVAGQAHIPGRSGGSDGHRSSDYRRHGTGSYLRGLYASPENRFQAAPSASGSPRTMREETEGRRQEADEQGRPIRGPLIHGGASPSTPPAGEREAQGRMSKGDAFATARGRNRRSAPKRRLPAGPLFATENKMRQPCHHAQQRNESGQRSRSRTARREARNFRQRARNLHRRGPRRHAKSCVQSHNGRRGVRKS